MRALYAAAGPRLKFEDDPTTREAMTFRAKLRRFVEHEGVQRAIVVLKALTLGQDRLGAEAAEAAQDERRTIPEERRDVAELRLSGLAR
jgi:hypothetical protein